MKVAIIPFSSLPQSESLPVYRYFKAQGADITAFYWGEPELPEDIGSRRIEQGQTIEGLEEFDLVVRGPSTHPKQIVSAKKVTTLTNLFFENCPTKNIIGITGTKGKGTTSTLTAKMLEAAGKKVWLGGNIGRPLLDNLDEIQPEDWVVLELANFQLIDLKTSPHIAVCLMVVPEHLDWHKDTEEYIAAKQQLFAHQSANDIAVFYAKNDNSKKIADVSPGKKIPYMEEPGAVVENDAVKIGGQEICKTSEIKLLGKHNWQNVCAAVTAVWQVSQNVKTIRSIVKSFSGLPFRIEPRGKKDGVTFYNDSFAVTLSATHAALAAIPEPKVLIMGGYDRGLDLHELIKIFQDKKSAVRKVIVIGASGDRVVQNFKDHGFNDYIQTDEKNPEVILKLAKEQAEKGDAIVLSPGFASFDMFQNFEDRGNQFNAAFEKL